MPELDNEALIFAEVIGTAPQQSEVVSEAAASAALEGNFSDRAPVDCPNTLSEQMNRIWDNDPSNDPTVTCTFDP